MLLPLEQLPGNPQVGGRNYYTILMEDLFFFLERHGWEAENPVKLVMIVKENLGFEKSTVVTSKYTVLCIYIVCVVFIVIIYILYIPFGSAIYYYSRLVS